MAEQPAPPTAAELLASPSTSFWLKSALVSAMKRDPIDAAADSELLTAVLSAQADAMLKGETRS